MSIQRNQSVVCYSAIPNGLSGALDFFMCDTEVDRDSFRRMIHFYKYIEANLSKEELNILKLFLAAENIEVENAWIQFW